MGIVTWLKEISRNPLSRQQIALPKTIFHGTASEFKTFDFKEQRNDKRRTQEQAAGAGIYFTSSYKVAKEFADYAADEWNQKGGGKPKVIEQKLNPIAKILDYNLPLSGNKELVKDITSGLYDWGEYDSANETDKQTRAEEIVNKSISKSKQMDGSELGAPGTIGRAIEQIRFDLADNDLLSTESPGEDLSREIERKGFDIVHYETAFEKDDPLLAPTKGKNYEAWLVLNEKGLFKENPISRQQQWEKELKAKAHEGKKLKGQQTLTSAVSTSKRLSEFGLTENPKSYKYQYIIVWNPDFKEYQVKKWAATSKKDAIERGKDAYHEHFIKLVDSDDEYAFVIKTGKLQPKENPHTVEEQYEIDDTIENAKIVAKGVVSELKKNPDDSLIEKSKKHFGTTKNPNEAGYLLPDGSMLDLSGRHYASGYQNNKPLPGKPDYLKNQRSTDHRELEGLVSESGTKGMLEFMKGTDAIRMAVLSGDANVAFFKEQKPTPAQVKALSEINSMYGGEIIYDIWDEKGDTVKSGKAKTTKAFKSVLLENPLSRQQPKKPKPALSVKTSIDKLLTQSEDQKDIIRLAKIGEALAKKVSNDKINELIIYKDADWATGRYVSGTVFVEPKTEKEGALAWIPAPTGKDPITGGEFLISEREVPRMILTAIHEGFHQRFANNATKGHEAINKLKDLNYGGDEFEGLIRLGTFYTVAPEELKTKSPQQYKIVKDWIEQSEKKTELKSLTTEIRPSIFDTGYPVHTKGGAVSGAWKKAHPAANKAALKEFGSEKAKEISKLVKQLPEGELLGKHTRAGKIIISAKVPKALRPAIQLHEEVEHAIMAKKVIPVVRVKVATVHPDKNGRVRLTEKDMKCGIIRIRY